MRRIYWDTMLFAYWLEGERRFAPRVQSILESMTAREDVLCASAFTLAELLVFPVKRRDSSAVEAIENFFGSGEVAMLEFLPGAPRIFATLRASENLKPMDAFHLSLATAAGVDVFLTNDRRLHSVKQPGFPLVASLETDIF